MNVPHLIVDVVGGGGPDALQDSSDRYRELRVEDFIKIVSIIQVFTNDCPQ